LDVGRKLTRAEKRGKNIQVVICTGLFRQSGTLTSGTNFKPRNKLSISLHDNA